MPGKFYVGRMSDGRWYVHVPPQYTAIGVGWGVIWRDTYAAALRAMDAVRRLHPPFTDRLEEVRGPKR